MPSHAVSLGVRAVLCSFVQSHALTGRLERSNSSRRVETQPLAALIKLRGELCPAPGVRRKLKKVDVVPCSEFPPLSFTRHLLLPSSSPARLTVLALRATLLVLSHPSIPVPLALTLTLTLTILDSPELLRIPHYPYTRVIVSLPCPAPPTDQLALRISWHPTYPSHPQVAS
jgi:hypothetical protein